MKSSTTKQSSNDIRKNLAADRLSPSQISLLDPRPSNLPVGSGRQARRDHSSLSSSHTGRASDWRDMAATCFTSAEMSTTLPNTPNQYIHSYEPTIHYCCARCIDPRSKGDERVFCPGICPRAQPLKRVLPWICLSESHVGVKSPNIEGGNCLYDSYSDSFLRAHAPLSRRMRGTAGASRSNTDFIQDEYDHSSLVICFLSPLS